MKFKGKIAEIIYTNEENGYSVIVFDAEDRYFTAVGIFPLVAEGEYLIIEGEFKHNKKYGEQFVVTNAEYSRPDNLIGVFRYLSSGLFRGIGEKTAQLIVDHFGMETLEIIDKSPEKLIEVSGIGRKKLMEIIASYEETRAIKETVLFLQQYDISMNLAMKIYKKYGDSTQEILKKNPYLLVNDIEGVGFLTADKIAKKMGIPNDSDFRICAGIMHVLQDSAARGGHTCLPKGYLLNSAMKLLNLDIDIIEKAYCGMSNIKESEIDGELLVANEINYNTENSISAKLVNLNNAASKSDIDLNKELNIFERQTDIILDETQRAAIKSVFNNGISVITGGPGTGKTTIIKGVVNVAKNRGKRYLLCAPTGRASKRMMEATGEDAKTIHRLLGIEGLGGHCCYNEKTPLPVDVLIVDEISMADIYIFNTLLKSIPIGARLVLVGDKDQLPSVACGNILSDIISSGIINVVYLNQVYRQSKFSTIVENAHRINRGEMPVVKNAKDFFFDNKNDVYGIQNSALSMIKSRIPTFLGIDSSEIQILTPIKKTEIGVESMNALLQDALNPTGSAFTYKDRVFRTGDKVMQTQNNYQLEWRRKTALCGEEVGTGVFNGDIGFVSSVGKDFVNVEYEDGKTVRYESGTLDDLTLAYCISVHKSQGSEFPVVILVLPKSAHMLLTRNLIYTAVTRAKKMVVIIGEESVLRGAINNTHTTKRYSLLKNLILKNKEKAEILWGTSE